MTHVNAILQKIRSGRLTVDEAVEELAKENNGAWFPLSQGQMSLWWHQQITPLSTGYHIPLCLKLTNRVDLASLEKAFAFVLRQHPVLATTIRRVDGIPSQSHNDDLRVEVAQKSFGPDESVDGYITDFIRRPFSLERGPLLRAALLLTPSDEQLFLIVFHHLIIDGNSLDHFLKSLFSAHRAFTEGRMPKHEEQLASYADFVEWEQALLTSKRGKTHLEFWKEHLADAPPLLDLPTDYSRHTSSRACGQTFAHLLTRDIWEQVQAFCRKHAVSPAAFLLSLYYLLLHRYTSQDDLVVGVPTMIRPEERFESLVGYFVNVMPLRARLEGTSTLVEFSRSVQLALVDGLDHAEYPLAALVRELKIPRAEGVNPIFQVLFNFQNAGLFPLQESRPDDTLFGSTVVETYYQEGEYELVLQLYQRKDDCLLHLKYDPELFERKTVERMCHHYLNLLSEAIRTPNLPLSRFSMITNEEVASYTTWNETDTTFDSPEHVLGLIEQQARRSPDVVAVVCNGTSMTYRNLLEQSENLARELIAANVVPNDKIAICIGRSIGMLVSLLAVWKAGAAYVPLDPNYPVERLAHMLQDCGAKLILAQAEALNRIPSLFTRLSVNRVLIDEIGTPTDPKVCSDTPDSAKQFNEPGDLAYVIYTSGSTGKPKGVMVRHRGLRNVMLSLAREPGFSANDTILALTTLSFDIAGAELFLPLICGGRCAVVETEVARDASRLIRAIAEIRPTIVQATPATWSLLIEAGWTNPGRVKIWCGGEALPVPLKEKMMELGAEVWNLFGPTETTIWSAVCKISPDSAVRIGKPIANTQLHVFDRNGQLTPFLGVGELYIGGQGVAAGYWNQPALTSERFIEDPSNPKDILYRTGDLVRWHPDGNLEYLRRSDSQVKVRGFRIELGDVEDCLSRHSKVTACAALVSEQSGHKRLIAYCVGKDIEIAELREHAKAALPDYMVPARFVIVDELPLTPNGKVDRKQLQEQRSPAIRAQAQSSERSDIERRLLGIWEDVLDGKDFSPDHGFFDIGGDSFLALIVAERIASEFGHEFGVTELFKYGSVRQIANYLASKGQISNEVKATSSVSVPDVIVPKAHETVDPRILVGCAAIIGISCQFPGARNHAQFWQNLRQGHDSVESTGDATSGDSANGHFVPARYTIKDKECFDPAFFKISKRDALLMDPQLRLLLANAWSAVEDSGYVPTDIADAAVVMSASNSGYGPRLTANQTESYLSWIVSQGGTIPAMVSNKLDLHGPSYFVHSNCSSSLVGLHAALKAIRSGECIHALVGAATIFPWHSDGYYHEPGMNFSSDGRVKAFDASADGMVGGEGVAVVLLKEASRAVADRDNIYAVLRGVEINNDGADKAGFYAPSVRGQTDAIEKVLRSTGVDPETIGYLEAHGTGTKLGDPIEFCSLSEVYGKRTSLKQFCALGSVKTNVGHLDTAAGLASLIKAAMSVRDGEIVPSLHFSKPNTAIPLKDSPFFVPVSLTKWERRGFPRRCAIASLGIGGTNAHAILEEAPTDTGIETRNAEESVWLVPLSAQSDEQLKDYCRNLLDFLSSNTRPPVELVNLAYTLCVGRVPMISRIAFVARDLSHLRQQLADVLSGHASIDGVYRSSVSTVVEGVDVLLSRPGTHRELSRLAESWVKGLAVDWSQLYGEERPRRISLPSYPFARERYWVPAVAPEAPAGSGSEAVSRLHPLLHRNTSDLDGTRFSSTFTGDEFFFRDHVVDGRRVLPGAAQLELARAAVEQVVGGLPPGHGIRLENVVFLRPVVAGEGPLELHIALSEEEDGAIGYEIYGDGTDEQAPVYGQGRASIVETHEAPRLDTTAPSLLRIALPEGAGDGADYVLHPSVLDAALQGIAGLTEQRSEAPALAFALDRLEVFAPCQPAMWAHVRTGEGSTEAVARFDVDVADGDGRVCVRLRGLSSRVLKEGWEGQPASATETMLLTPVWDCVASEEREVWPRPSERVVIVGGCDRWRSLRARYPGACALELDAGWQPGQIMDALRAAGEFDHVMWIAPDDGAASVSDEALIDRQDAGVIGLFRLLKAVLQLGHDSRALGWTIITTQTQAVAADEDVDPTHASVHGLAGSMAKEYLHWKVRVLDTARATELSAAELATMLQAGPDGAGDVHAWRDGQLYRRKLVATRLPAQRGALYRQGGVYVVIGGAGGIGAAWSEHMVRDYQAQVIWLGRRPLDETIEAKLDELGRLGPRPRYVQADAADRQSLEAAYAGIREEHGAVNGIVHSAVALDDRSLARMDEAAFRKVLASKVDISVRLAQVFGAEALDLVLFFSSMISFGKPAGQSNYAAGCTFLDAHARQLGRAWSCPVKIVNWGYWGSVGVVASPIYREKMSRVGLVSLETGEAMAALEDLLGASLPQMAVVKVKEGFTEGLYAEGLYEPRQSIIVQGGDEASGFDAAPSALAPPALVPEGEEFDAAARAILRARLSEMGLLEGSPAAAVSAKYGRWLEESRQVLAESGSPATADLPAAWQAWEEGRRRWLASPYLGAQCVLAEKALHALPEVLTGKVRATDVLFPNGSLALVEGIYKDNPVADYFNDVVVETVVHYVEARLRQDAGARIRILEIGAGTGGTSARVFAGLAPYREHIEEYCYTDLSQAFLLHAREAYGAANPFLSCRLFDVEKPPGEQGIEAGAYDLVIAANVLHATKDIRKTLRHAKATLRRNGVLVLNELTGKNLFTHLTFGLLDGWWLAEDVALRLRGSPGLASEAWRAVLQGEGFGSIAQPAATAASLGQQIIVSASDGVVRQEVAARVAARPQAKDRKARPDADRRPGAVAASTASVLDRVRASLAQEVSRLIKLAVEEVEAESELSEYGFDSISFTQLARRLNEVYGLSLTPPVFYEHPTLTQLAQHLVEAYPALKARFSVAEAEPLAEAVVAEPAVRRRSGRARVRRAVEERASLPERDRIAIVGMSGCFPMARDVASFWDNLVAERDCISEVPAERWDWRSIYGDPREDANKTNVKWGGFIEGVDEFDPLFFGISPREAELMDPQQRLLMTHVWKALEDAGYSAQSLSGSRTALFIGTANSGYGALATQGGRVLEAYSLFGLSASLGPNRMSYFLNLHGPSEPVDTACSSSLVALHRAVSALHADQCDLAIVGGVNTVLTPDGHIGLTKAGMLSVTGRCQAFSRHADGFVRSEGVGMLVLRKLRSAQRDGDHIYGLVLGSAENHGGRAQSLTAPNPKAQADLLKAAYSDAGIDPATVSYVETHGTGTVLGDPIEINGLKSAFREMGDARGETLAAGRCGLGSVKASIGHLELAAGVAGVIKVLMQMKHRRLVRSLHSEELNSYIELADSPFYIVQQSRSWEPLHDAQGRPLPRRAGVSSFGVGGVNAHVVLEEYVPAEEPPREGAGAAAPAIVVLSAKNEERLRERTAQLQAALERDGFTDADLGDIAYTLQVGRDAMECRLGVVVSSLSELQSKLGRFLSGESAIDGLYQGQVKQEKDTLALFGGDEELQEAIGKWVSRGKFEKLLHFWVKGLTFDWSQLYGEERPRRISLPSYPFARERYWVPAAPEGSPAAGGADGTARLHPLLHRNTSDLDGARFSSTFTGDEFFFRDHVVDGRRVLPAAAQLELARAAVKQVVGGLPPGHGIRLENVVFLRPVVAGEGPLELHIALSEEDDGAIGYEIYGDGTDEQAPVYGQGRASIVETQQPPRLDLDDLREQTRHLTVSAEECYAAFSKIGLDYGASFQGLVQSRAGTDAAGSPMALGMLQLPASAEKAAAAYVLHPSLIDAALQSGIGPGLKSQELEQGKPTVPFALEEVEQLAPLPRTAWAWMRHSPGSTPQTPIARFDVDVVDADGRVCVRLRGFSARVLTAEADKRATDLLPSELTLSVSWRSTLVPPVSQWPKPSQKLLVIGGTQHQQDAISGAFPQARFVSAETTKGIGLLTKEFAAAGQFDHLFWILPETRAETSESMLEHQEIGAFAGFRILKSLLSLGYGDTPLGLTVLTTLTQQIHPTDTSSPSHASLHGLLGSVAKEYEQWKVRLIDLEDVNCPLQQILAMPPDPDGDAICYRRGQWYRQSLSLCHLQDASACPYAEEGVYVVIGGAGGIGEAFTRHLLSQVNAQVVWIGRRPLDDDIRIKLSHLKSASYTPAYFSVDPEAPESYQQILEEVRTRYGRVRGVVHSAIVLADRSLMRMTESEFASGLQAKVNSSAWLEELPRDEPPDFVLLFSALQSLTKAAGQSNYAAGCTFVDSLADHLRSKVNATIKVVNWGYWGTIGIAATPELRAHMRNKGLDSIEPDKAMAMIDRLLMSPVNQVVYVKTMPEVDLRDEIPVADELQIAVGVTQVHSHIVSQRVLSEPEKVAATSQIAAFEKVMARRLIHRLRGLSSHAVGTVEWTRETGMSEKYRRWLSHALDIADVELGQKCSESSSAARHTFETDEYQKEALHTLDAHLRLADRSLDMLPDVLQGKVPATDVLFPNGSLALVEGIYKDNPVADYFNDVVVETVVHYVEARLRQDAGARIRILEIGAGTGGTSARVFAGLAPYREHIEEYCYTDLSQAFLLHAREAYGAANPFLSCRLFDVEKPPGEQGIEAGAYDLVIAANVLHATKDIRKTLRHAKATLRRNGVLLVNELSRSGVFNHMTFGLLDGWWWHSDVELRGSGSPILLPLTWKYLLEGEGFRQVAFPAANAHDLGSQVVTAESDGFSHRPLLRTSTASPRNRGHERVNTASMMEARSAASRQETGAPMAALMSSQRTYRSVIEFVRNVIADAVKINPAEIDEAEPLEAYGVDSLVVTKVVSGLRKRFSNVANTTLFEYSTVEAIAKFLSSDAQDAVMDLEKVSVDYRSNSEDLSVGYLESGKGASSRRRAKRQFVQSARIERPAAGEAVAIVALTGRYPGAETLEEFWKNLAGGVDGVREVPAERWSIEEYFDAEKGKAGKTYSKWGGFLEGVEFFDPLFFNISPRDAERMDPQGRLLLETVWRLLEGSGLTRSAMRARYEGRVGVYVGAGGVEIAGLANSISYFFDFEGPSIAVDTMCSSSAIAIHLACRALLSGDCEVAIAAGVNLLLGPDRYIALSQLQMLGSHVESRSFGNGDGYIPAEGVGAVLLKPLAKAQADGDEILAVIKGSATRHSGRASGYAVPNPSLQAKVAEESLRLAGVDSATISYVEAAANGSALGDPIEVAALSKVFAAAGSVSCALGSVKSTIGHSEAASGIAQLTKVVLQMRHRQLVPTIRSESLNPNLQLEETPFVLQRELGPWNRPKAKIGGVAREVPLRALIDSYGAGGSYVSLVVEEYVPAAAPLESVRPAEAIPQVCVFSAKHVDQLHVVVRNMIAYLEQHETVSMPELSYTLQAGREAMDVRLALIARTPSELLEGLKSYIGCSDDEGVCSVTLYTGDLDANPLQLKQLLSGGPADTMVREMIAANDIDRLALYWCHGGSVPWQALWGHNPPRTIPLPGYPFNRQPLAFQSAVLGQRSITAQPQAMEPLVAVAAERFTQGPPSRRDQLSGVVREFVRTTLRLGDSSAFSASKPLNQFGMTSIDLVSLKYVLERACGAEVPLALIGRGELSTLALVERLEAEGIAGTTALSSNIDVPSSIAGTASSPSLPELVGVPEHRFSPFPLTDIQQAFLAGRSTEDGSGARIYLEFELSHRVDCYELNRAWRCIVERHDALRIIISEAYQVVLKDIPPYSVKYLDCRGLDEAAFERHRSQLRRRMEATPYEPSQWPHFDIRVSLKENAGLVHFSIDELVVDATSLFILLDEWMKLYEDPGTSLPQLSISFRDYVTATKAFEESGRHKADSEYWLAKVATYCHSPLPPPQAGCSNSCRLNDAISRSDWERLKSRAAEMGITPTVLVLSIFIEVLREHSSLDAFSLVLTNVNRLPLHPQINDIVGPLIATSFYVATPREGFTFEELIIQNQREFWRDLDHPFVTTIEIIRKLRQRDRKHLSAPVVFTSMLNLNAHRSGQAPAATYAVNQTPDVALDHQVAEVDGELRFSWDVVPGLENLFQQYCRALKCLAEGREPWTWQTLAASIGGANRLSLLDEMKNELRSEAVSDEALPFQLTDQQLAYVYGQKASGSSCFLYQELTSREIDTEKLKSCFEAVIAAHPMLRATICDDGMQFIRPISTCAVPVLDLRSQSDEWSDQSLRAVRQQMTSSSSRPEEDRFLELRVSRCRDRDILHLRIDLLIADGQSIGLFFKQIVDGYNGHWDNLTPPKLTFKRYRQAVQRVKASAAGRDALEYWNRKFADLPNGPKLPEIPRTNSGSRLRNRTKQVFQRWGALKARSEALGLEPATIVLTAYLETLFHWNQARPLTVVVPTWARLPVHHQIDDVIGDFTALCWIPRSAEQMSFVKRALHYQEVLARDLASRPISGLGALRKWRARREEALEFPVVFTDMAKPLDRDGLEGFEPADAITATPGVLLDNLSVEANDALICTWDTDGELDPGSVELMLSGHIRMLDLLAEDPRAWDRTTFANILGVHESATTDAFLG